MTRSSVDPAAPTLRVGAGDVVLHPTDGGPLQFRHPDAPDRRYLLDEDTEAWHTAEHRWGSGFLISDRASARWNAPDRLEVERDRMCSGFDLADTGVHLDVARTGGATLEESYTWTNRSAVPVSIRSLGLSTPFRDVYPDADSALRTAVHAHVFTGGSWAWVLAEPMDAEPPALGLIVTSGELSAYSVESRNTYSFSNVRGHMILQPTDAGRNTHAFGGQRPIELAPGGSYTLTWELRWFTDRREFVRATEAPLVFDRLATDTAGEVLVTGPGAAAVEVTAPAVVHRDGDTVRIRSTSPGPVEVTTGAARTRVMFHDPLETLVRRRVGYVMHRQRPRERRWPDRAAFVPIDTRTGLTTLTSGWPDWSDGAERVGMAVLLQQARLRHWVDDSDAVDAALREWAVFARTRLLDDTAAPRWGSDTIITKTRLYNSPWLAHFFADQFRLFGASDDLDLAARILERSFELGATEHLSIGQPEAVLAVATLLEQREEPARADALRTGLVKNAEHFAGLGRALPSHEVNYEQSMVAPLVSLYALADSHQPAPRFEGPLTEALRWLLAFGGPQPHVHLHDIGIRHWDGYFFGLDRQWGDVFPHHWSALTAVALSQLPAPLRTAATDRAVTEIFRANLLNQLPDGSASAAFVFPSTVDGRVAHRYDPQANDQDWALALWLRSGTG